MQPLSGRAGVSALGRLLSGGVPQALVIQADWSLLAQAGFDPMVTSVAEANSTFDSEVASWAKMVNAIGFSN